MSRLFPLLLSLAAFYLGAKNGLLDAFVTRNPASLSGNTCDGKKFCAVVYLAPWCPHCREALPSTQALLAKAKLGDTGVKVVVGMEQRPGDNQAMASRIAQGVVIDEGLAIARQFEIRSVPTYLVLDQEGSKILDGQESYTWIMEKFKL